MYRVTFRVLLVVMALASTKLPVSAGPPLKTDDPDTPGRGGWEINISHNIELTKDELLMESPLIDINYGLLENDQWKLEFPVLFLDPDGGQELWGIGDLLLGWKYRFLEQDEVGFMASTYPQLLVPFGDEDENSVSGGRMALLVPLEVGKQFFDEKLFVYGEVGYNIVFGDQDSNELIYGVAAEWQATDKLVLAGDVGGVVFPAGDDPDDTFFLVGLKCELTENLTFIGAVGRTFHDRRRGTPILLTFFGIQITTGGSPDSTAEDFVLR